MLAKQSLLLASLAFIATPLLAQPQYAWVGTYNPNGEGLYRFEHNPDTGALTNRTLAATLPNVAQLTLSADGKTLYAASEVKQGVVQAWRVAENGDLTALNQVSSGGDGPVWLSLMPSGKHLLVANYVSGSIAVLPVNADGSLRSASEVKQDQGPAGAARPAAAAEGSFAISDHHGPHSHMIASDPSGRYVFATDLGLDRLYQYRFDAVNGKLIPNDPPFLAASSAGAGPRHFVFAPDGSGLWLINEEASTLTWYALNSSTGTLTQGESISSLPPAYKGTNFAAGLAISKDGKQLYVANRLHNSIGHFTVSGGKLTWQDDVWTRGDYPRSLQLDPSGRWLYALNQRSDNITRFRVAADGKLAFIKDYTPVGSPSQMAMTSP